MKTGFSVLERLIKKEVGLNPGKPYFPNEWAKKGHCRTFLLNANGFYQIRFERITGEVAYVLQTVERYKLWYDFPEGSQEHESRSGGIQRATRHACFESPKDAIAFYMKHMYGVTDCPFEDIKIDIDLDDCEPIEPWALAWLELSLFDQQVAA